MRTGLALSVQQPWAWCIVHGYKPVENRDWPTRVRGTIGIHAGQKHDVEGEHWIRETFPEIPLPPASELPRGGIVGRVDLVDCVEEFDSPWFFGRFGFVVRDQEPLELIPCRGQLGFFRPAIAASGRARPDGEAQPEQRQVAFGEAKADEAEHEDSQSFESYASNPGPPLHRGCR